MSVAIRSMVAVLLLPTVFAVAQPTRPVSVRQLEEDIRLLRALNQLCLTPGQLESLATALEEGTRKLASVWDLAAMAPQQLAGLTAIRDGLLQGAEPTPAAEAAVAGTLRAIGEQELRVRREIGRVIAGILNAYQIERLAQLGDRSPDRQLAEARQEAERRLQRAYEVIVRAARASRPGAAVPQLVVEEGAAELVRLKFPDGAPELEGSKAEAMADLAEIIGMGRDVGEELLRQKARKWAADPDELQRVNRCVVALDLLLQPRMVELIKLAAQARQPK